MDLRADNKFLQQVVAMHEEGVGQQKAAIEATYDAAALEAKRAEIAQLSPVTIMRELLQTNRYVDVCEFEDSGWVFEGGSCRLQLPEGETQLCGELTWYIKADVDVVGGETEDRGHRRIREFEVPADLYLSMCDLEGNAAYQYVATLGPDGTFSYAGDLLEDPDLDDEVRQAREEAAVLVLQDAMFVKVMHDAVSQARLY